MGRIWMEIRKTMLKNEKTNDPSPYKTALTKPTSPPDLDTTERRNDEDVETKNEKEMVLIIGNSQTTDLDPVKFSSRVTLEKVTQYTIKDAQDWLATEEAASYKKVKTVVIHLITNDVKQMTAVACANSMIHLVESFKQHFKQALVVVSLGTPRGDGRQDKVKLVNDMLRDGLQEDGRTKLCHHENLQNDGRIKVDLYKRDMYHLRENGTKLLAANIRHAVEKGYSTRKKNHAPRTHPSHQSHQQSQYSPREKEHKQPKSHYKPSRRNIEIEKPHNGMRRTRGAEPENKRTQTNAYSQSTRTPIQDNHNRWDNHRTHKDGDWYSMHRDPTAYDHYEDREWTGDDFPSSRDSQYMTTDGSKRQRRNLRCTKRDNWW